MKVLVVGNGIAGNEVAFALRALGARCEITILSAENWPEYDPCSLPYFVGGDIQREAVFRRRLFDYKQHSIELILGNEAISIDPQAKHVVTRNGKTYPFDKLVLANGGRLVIPPLDGIDQPGIFSCKELGEADRLHQHKGGKAVVIGSGAIGVEAAEALNMRGLEVTIIELLGWMLPTMFDEPVARRLESALRGYGIEILTAERVQRVERDGETMRVVTNKREIPCDTIVTATGVAPQTALAKEAGLHVERGIIVDDSMATSHRDIYACGDCVQARDAFTGERCVYQFKHNAIEQARVAARNILGEKASYRGSYTFARAHFFETHAAMFGKTMRSVRDDGDLEVIDREGDSGCLRIILKEGKIVGGQAIGESADNIGLFLGAMWREDDIDDLRVNWQQIARLDSRVPWIYRKLGRLMGLPTDGGFSPQSHRVAQRRTY